MNTSGQGCGFPFHQGNAHGQGWNVRWKQISSFSTRRLAPAAGVRQRPEDPHTPCIHSFLRTPSPSTVSHLSGAGWGDVVLAQGARSVQLMVTAAPGGLTEDISVRAIRGRDH